MADSNLDQESAAAGKGHLIQPRRLSWLMVVAGTVLGVVAAGSVYLAYPQVYRTEAKLLVRADHPAPSNPLAARELLLEEAVTVLSAWETLASARNTLAEQSQVSSELSVANRSEAEAVGTLQENLQVAGLAPSVITLKYHSRDPKDGPAVLNAIVGSYYEILREWEEHAENVVSRKPEVARMRVIDLEKRLSEVLSAAEIVPTANGESALEEALREAQRDANATSDEVAAEAAKITALEKRTDPQGLADARLRFEALKAKGAVIEARVEELATKLSKVGPEVADLRRALEKEREAFERLASGMLNSGYGDEEMVNTIPRVVVLQRPLGPTRETESRDVLMGVLVGLGPVLGLALGRWRSGSALRDRVDR